MMGPTKEDKELFEEILKDKAISDAMLKPELSEYIESLLNLEISALSKNNISIKEEEALKQLEVYRKVVYYNIMLRGKKLVDNTSDKYNFIDSFDSFFIDLKHYDDENYNNQLFLIGRDLEYNSYVELYSNENMSFEEYMKKNRDYIQQIKDEMNFEFNSQALIGQHDEYKLLRLTAILEELESKSDKTWQNDYNRDMFIASEQRSYLRLFLDDAKLKEDDFTKDDKNNLVREGKVYRLTIEK